MNANPRLKTSRTGFSGLRTGIRYQPDETPPMALAFGLGLQLAVLTIAGIVLTPAIVIRAAGGTEDFLSWAVFAAILVSGVTTILQVVRFGRIGAGYVLLMGTSGAFIAVCVAAIAEGGPAMLATLVVISALFQFALSARLSLFRRIPDAGRCGHGTHADRGNGDADRLRHAQGRAGRDSGAGRTAERARDPTRHHRHRPESHGYDAPVGAGYRRRHRLGGRRVFRSLRRRPRRRRVMDRSARRAHGRALIFTSVRCSGRFFRRSSS